MDPTMKHDNSPSDLTPDLSDEELLQYTQEQNRRESFRKVALGILAVHMDTDYQFLSALVALPKSLRIPS
jgi:hypothetical protein